MAWSVEERKLASKWENRTSLENGSYALLHFDLPQGNAFRPLLPLPVAMLWPLFCPQVHKVKDIKGFSYPFWKMLQKQSQKRAMCD